MTASKFDELEKRIATLETHVKVAVIVGTFIGVTGSGLVTILWTGFREAKREVDAVEKNAISLDGRIGSLRADIDSNLAVTVDNRKKEIVAFAANQMARAVHDALATFKANATTRAWQPLQLQNGWSNSSVGYPNASLYKDTLGVVHLRGVVSGGASNVIVAILPLDFRPPAAMVFGVACGETQPCRAIINTEGAVWFSPGASWVSLNEVHFTTE